MTTYTYTGTGLRRSDGTTIEPGDTFEPTDAELAAFGDSMQPVETEQTQDEPDREPDAVVGEPFENYDEYTVNELETIVPELATDVLRQAREYDDRSTAHSLIDAELEEREE